MTDRKAIFSITKRHLLGGLLGIGLLFGTTMTYFRYEVKKARKLGKAYKKFFSMCEKQIIKDRPQLGGLSTPKELQNIPLAEKLNIIIDVKTVPIRGVTAPYNASIERVGDEYLLFFRYDTLTFRETPPFYTSLGVCRLNQDFQQTEAEYHNLNTNSKFSEDPRFIQVGSKNFIVYNDLLKDVFSRYRTIHLAEIDINTLKLKTITNLDIQLGRTEKNWTPFVYTEDGKANLFFEYFINPHKILKLPDMTKNELIHKSYTKGPAFQNLPWSRERWGELRGGTPAKKVGDEYLSFFHSLFEDKDGFYWYVMGAYTFESKPPFNITSISKYPILFEGIYDTIPANSSDPTKRSIYPAGFALGKKDGKDVIHVSCGENDSAVKIITFDQKALLDSLEKTRR